MTRHSWVWRLPRQTRRLGLGHCSRGESTSSSRGGSTKYVVCITAPHRLPGSPEKRKVSAGLWDLGEGFFRFGRRFLRLDGKPVDTHTTKKKFRMEVGGGERGHWPLPQKRVMACGGSRMSNSSAVIEIVVECRRNVNSLR